MSADPAPAARIDPDACVVVDRAELEAAANAAMLATDTLAVRQGMVGGLIAAAFGVAFWSLAGATEFNGGLFALLLVSASVGALVWRIWDVRAVRFEVGVWSVTGFVAELKHQWEEEAHGG